ncbi:MAG: TIGR00645 family protein [Coxiellaceae bacterium]|nr:TIGR00645 family protein [Coxiellaceae bacterium]
MSQNLFEKSLFTSRWFLAPIYIGLSIALITIGVKFYQELYHLIISVVNTEESTLVLVVLGLIDLALVGGLLIMVMLSGYENFVSKIEPDSHSRMPQWLGRLDANSLKLKVAASIVAISSIHLLQKFMNAEHISNDKLMWYVLIHLTFVVSALLMGVLDKITKQT